MTAFAMRSNQARLCDKSELIGFAKMTALTIDRYKVFDAWEWSNGGDFRYIFTLFRTYHTASRCSRRRAGVLPSFHMTKTLQPAAMRALARRG